MSIKRQGHYLILVRDHSDFKVKTKVHMKAYGRMGMKIYINEFGHMIKMAAMFIYGKKLLKSSSLELID